jgi:hypothetical protein
MDEAYANREMAEMTISPPFPPIGRNHTLPSAKAFFIFRIAQS